jgi:hypothetical protein
MGRIQVNTAKLRDIPLTGGHYNATLLEIKYPFAWPSNPENVGCLWQFSVTEEGPFKGRRLSAHTTTTPEQPFAKQYKKFCDGLGVNADDWDPEDFGLPCAVVIEVQAKPNKDDPEIIYNNVVDVAKA